MDGRRDFEDTFNNPSGTGYKVDISEDLGNANKEVVGGGGSSDRQTITGFTLYHFAGGCADADGTGDGQYIGRCRCKLVSGTWSQQ